MIFIPSPPDWLFPKEPSSAVLYLVLSESETKRWNDLYDGISRASQRNRSRRLSGELEEQLKAFEEEGDDTIEVMSFPLLFR